MPVASESESSVHPVQLDEIKTGTAKAKAAPWVEQQIELIRDVKVSVTARLGSSEMSVAHLFALGEGDALKLDRDVNAPVDLLLEGQVIARGQLVVVGENFGVRITEIIRPTK